MSIALPILAIVAGLLAAASVVIKKLPDAAKVIEKIKPYEGFIGASALAMGIINLFTLTRLFKYSFFYGSISAACIGSAIVMGFLLGYPVLQGLFIDDMSEEARTKSEELYERLTPYKVTAGLVAMGTGAFLLVA